MTSAATLSKPLTDAPQLAGHLLVQCLIEQGVTHAFGVPGESYLAVLDGFHRHADRIHVVDDGRVAAWYAANREQAKAYSAAYRATNREEIAAYREALGIGSSVQRRRAKALEGAS